RRESEI
nr:Chain P, ARG-ARG-GLU-SER-GLU-ILE [Homo sapiens]6SPZ_Q Chain Q, ARG-ARG-GLU-SER-GLU-ILE [Homo sapiens]